MAPLHRLLVSAAIIAGVAVGMCRLGPTALAEAGRDLLHVPACFKQLSKEQNRSRLLASASQRTHERSQCRQELARAVLDGRLSLRQAAARLFE